jgi:hypothetical protein
VERSPRRLLDALVPRPRDGFAAEYVARQAEIFRIVFGEVDLPLHYFTFFACYLKEFSLTSPDQHQHCVHFLGAS